MEKCSKCGRGLPSPVPSEWVTCPYCNHELNSKRKDDVVADKTARFKPSAKKEGQKYIGESENGCIYCSESSKTFNESWKYCPVCGKTCARVLKPVYASKTNGKWTETAKPGFSTGTTDFSIFLGCDSGSCKVTCDVSECKGLEIKGSNRKQINKGLGAYFEFRAKGIPSGQISFRLGINRNPNDKAKRDTPLVYKFNI